MPTPPSNQAAASATASQIPDAKFLDALAQAATQSGLFGPVTITTPPATPGRVSAQALASAEPAFYRFELAPEGPAISLVTGARYLSQSIEADLVHTGDKLDDLLADELIDQGYTGPPLKVDHFRDQEKLFTFRTRLPQSITDLRTPAGIETITRILRAYEACFRQLGDMEADDEE